MTKVILGIAGEIAAGKGTTAKYLVEKCGASTHRFSTALRDVAKRMYLDESRENLQQLSTLMRDGFDDNILSRVIYNDVGKDSCEVVVIDGVRRMKDIEFLEKMPEFKLIYIEADLRKRYERITKRRENIDDKEKTFDEFRRDNKREAEIQIKYLKDEADFVIDNNGTLEELYAQIDKIVA
ncbi:MAG: AAA family ATPase [Parcubacteria group bacterium]|jgi:dephospho-CoA kinase